MTQGGVLRVLYHWPIELAAVPRSSGPGYRTCGFPRFIVLRWDQQLRHRASTSAALPSDVL